MKKSIFFALALILAAIPTACMGAEKPVSLAFDAEQYSPAFPNLGDSFLSDTFSREVAEDLPVTPAIWPFGRKDEDASGQKKLKSPRKAFFLSFIFPGLGEAYVGSKRGFVFLGVEGLAWWMYLTNNREGKDIENDYQKFADRYWTYYVEDTENPDTPVYNEQYTYWEWLKQEYKVPNSIGPENFAQIKELIEEKTKSGGYESYHNLPSTKTQQYYEMIGKYGQFVYGWEDIVDHNPSLVDNEGNPTFNYTEDLQLIDSPLRMKYMSLRGDSNDKLKAAQRGIYIMMANRVFSAIDAARLAYHYNKRIESDLSMVRIRLVQKHIIDNDVPMIMISKNF